VKAATSTRSTRPRLDLQQHLKAAGLEPLQSQREAAAFLGVSIGTLERWRAEGNGPAYVQLSARAIAYRPADLRAFVGVRVRGA
jgi:hypothetical protein